MAKRLNGLIIILSTFLIFFYLKKDITLLGEDKSIAFLILFSPLIVLTIFTFGKTMGLLYFLFTVFFLKNYSRVYFPYLVGTNLTIGLVSSLLHSRFVSDIKEYRKNFLKIKERIDIFSREVEEKIKVKDALKKKFDRLFSFKSLADELSAILDLDRILHFAGEKIFEIVPKGEAVLIRIVKNKITFYYSPKTRESLQERIPFDVFDYWILREKGNLIINDIYKDFRFSSDSLEEIRRNFHSLLACPLTSEEKILGIVRLESSHSGVFTSDDLMMLDVFSDLLAVTLENAFLYQMTEELANRDSLTNLYLPRYLYNRLEEIMGREKEFSILMLDLDHFKDYNDRYGHIAGDIMLKKVAQLLLNSISGEDFAIRYGGEEFLLVLVNSGKEKAIKLAEEIREKVEKEIFYLRREATHVTVSIGVAFYPEDGRTKEELIHKADEWLYFAKAEGRNRIAYSGIK